MARVHRVRFSPARGVDHADRTVGELQQRGVITQTAGRYEGRRLELNGRMLFNFGSCSYMALEIRQELRDGATRGASEFGTQFPFSRAYLECPLYQELETLLSEMTGRPVVVAASTSLAHLATLPVVVRDEDAVIIDQFAHASLHTATELLRDVPVHLVRHNNIDKLRKQIEELSPRHAKIWLLIDGLYSMMGDFAPFGALAELLERFPKLHLYIDDAHSTSCFGLHGRGAALSWFGHHDRVLVALSLNKAFSSAGGAVAVPNLEIKGRIRRCGGPMLFSGPIQAPMLGVAVASAKLHLTREHAERQEELLRRLDRALAAADALGLPLATRERTPIFFIPRDSVDEVVETVHRFWEEGFYVCPSTFPAVPINHPGIRFTIGLHNEMEDIDAFLEVAKRVSSRAASA